MYCLRFRYIWNKSVLLECLSDLEPEVGVSTRAGMNEGAKSHLPDEVDPVVRHGSFTGSGMSLHGLRFSGLYRGVRV